MAHSQVRGVVIIARNGDRVEFYQDPKTYKPGSTAPTPLGASQSFELGSFLRRTYLTEGSGSTIRGISTELADNSEIFVRAKAGGEGTVVFDSAVALLQGLYPPTPKNRIVLANETTVVAPLGGYQYIPIETVEPHNDRSLEPWTECPNFEKHVGKVIASDEFKKRFDGATPFMRRIKDFVWGPTVSMENYWNVHEYVHAELTHNRSYAHRLPPTMIEQSRALVDFQQDKIFSDSDMGGIGNIAGRTILRSILNSLARIAYNGDPLQLFIQETTYQPFISLFHMTGLIDGRPDLKGVPNFASALAIELRRGPDADSRDYLRIKFKNGTADGDFQTLHAFGHKGDIPLSEFIYRTQNYQIKNNREWASACGRGSFTLAEASASTVNAACGGVLALVALLGLFVFARFRKARRQGQIRLGETPVEVKA